MNKRYTIIAALIMSTFVFGKLGAQEQYSLRDRANKLYNLYQYHEAIPLFQKLADSKKPKLEDLAQLAACYAQLNDYEAAEIWYKRVTMLPDSKPAYLLAYGNILKSNLKYEEAKKALTQYASSTGKSADVALSIAGCDSALVWLAHPTTHQLRNENAVNTPRSEFSVFPFQQKVFFVGEPDQQVLRSTDGRTGNPFLRIFQADRQNNQSLVNQLLDPADYNNGIYHIGPIVSNKAGSILYVTRTTTNKLLQVDEVNRTKYFTNNLELFIYKQNNGVWEPQPFAYNAVDKYAVGHAALSPDEKTLYFVSDMPGGLGGTDIWFCELQADGNWGKPQNAGANINTAQDEMFPYVNADGILYFSSNGWTGMGGLDIFSATGAQQKWTKAINLRYPINSPADDFAFITLQGQGTTVGYLSSNRKGGKGGDDIYSFAYQKPKLVLAVQGIVQHQVSKALIPGAQVSLYAGSQVIAKQQSTAAGTFFFELDNERDYTLIAQKEKFYGDTSKLSTKGLTKSDTLHVALNLESLFEIGKVFKLEDIKYDFDKDNIRPDAAKILNGLVAIMRDNPTLEIELGSHTDSRGSDDYNQKLSQRRAQSVVNYLVGRGIARSRMVAKGYGESQLLNNCSNGVPCTDAAHQENRRTVFKVLKY